MFSSFSFRYLTVLLANFTACFLCFLHVLSPSLLSFLYLDSPVGRRSPLLHVKNRPQPDTSGIRGDEQASQQLAAPKKESKTKRFQDMLKGSTLRRDEDDEEALELGQKPDRGRQRSMTLPSRHSKSLSKADDEERTGSLRRRSRSRSRSRGDDLEEQGVLAKADKDHPSPKPQSKGVGGLSAALGVGQRLVSSMRRRASNSSAAVAESNSVVATVANNQVVKSSPNTSRRPSVTPASPSPKLSRQDGDGSDASDTKPKDANKLGKRLS